MKGSLHEGGWGVNPAPRFTALVMAANRAAGDVVARAHGVSHKCLVTVAGETMLSRVLRALDDSPRVGRIAISIEDPAVVAGIPGLAARLERGELAVVPSAASPCLSALTAITTLDDPWPLLVTTADHPLLSPAMVDHFCGEALTSGADVAVAVAPESVVLAEYPDALRTFLPFRGDRYTGCNLFALMAPRATRAVEFWRRLEAHRKHPWRLFRAFGPAAALGFVAAAMAAVSRRLDVNAASVTMPFAEAAIDVDKLADLALVEDILRRRQVIGEQSKK
jgi:GTP:adenosylcobinamide-phosphate guanylyltransferase